MVVLAAALINKSGKALVSRQFVDMTRIRIEGLLAAFPKLIGSGKQHTYVETENVRYVYHPLESLYLILLTNKQSNILEDLETLTLLSKLIPEYCHNLDEESVCNRGFEIIFAFDEVISLGHKEAATGTQVKEYLEMDSQEEKMHRMLIQTKINETRDIMKNRAIQIDKIKGDKLRSDKSGSMGMISVRFDNGFSDNGLSSSNPPPPRTVSMSNQQSTTVKKGMQLGKTQKTNQFLESLKAEGELISEDLPTVAGSTVAAVTDPIVVTVEEKLVVTLRNDGGLDTFELQGILSLVVQSKDHAAVRVKVESGENDDLQFKTHPNIDKDVYTKQNILALKDVSKTFPTGTSTGILKWRLTSKDEALVPITINCWPSASRSGESFVSIEYEAQQRFELQNVVISIPLPALREPPRVNQMDGGDWRYDARKSVLEWSFELIDNNNRSGAMEFAVPAADSSSFFPIDVKFSAKTTYCDMKVASVTLPDGQSLSYGGSTQLLVDKYQVV